MIFSKVKNSFPSCWAHIYTYDHIDKMFNHSVATLRRNDFGIMPSLIEYIKKLYSLEPIFHTLKESIDIQRFMQQTCGEEKCTKRLNDIGFHHQLCIKNIDWKTFIWGR